MVPSDLSKNDVDENLTSHHIALPTLRLLLLVVNSHNGQLSWGYELLLPRELLPYVPQSRFICPEEGAGECCQGQCWPPVEDPVKRPAAASVCLHCLYGLDTDDQMKIAWVSFFTFFVCPGVF